MVPSDTTSERHHEINHRPGRAGQPDAGHVHRLRRQHPLDEDQQRHDDDGRDELDGRVHHLSAEVPADAVGGLVVRAEFVERVHQPAALFADGDQLQEQRREAVAIRLERILQRTPLFELRGHVGGDVAQRPRAALGLLLEDADRAQPGPEAVLEGAAPGDEGRQRALRGEHR
jgi:hypothetical protein